MNAPVVHGRKLAWIRDRLVLDQLPEHMKASRLLGEGPPPETSSNGDLVLSVLDQGRAGSCVGNGTAQAERAEEVRAGNTLAKLGSRLWIYYLGRAYDHDTANDDGCQIHNAFAAVAKYGIPAEEVWPYSDDSSPGAAFARMPSPEAFQAAFDAKVTLRAHRITSTGYDRVDDVKRALGQRRLICYGSDVSTDYCSGAFDATVPLLPPVGLKIAGGHCQVIVDHSGDSFRVANSWSPAWGDRGYSRWSADYIAWNGTSDLWIFDSCPKALEGGVA